MIRRPRCLACERRIWPWQGSVGWGVMGAKDNDRRRSWMRHIGCVRAQRAAQTDGEGA